MAKHVIFLFHGMGQYRKIDVKNKPLERSNSDEWFKGVQKTIIETYNNYNDLKKRPFEQHYEFVNINYDEYFDQILINTQDTVNKLSLALPGVVPSDLIKLFSKSTDIEDNFFWTHVMDVLMYKYIAEIRRLIKPQVAAVILRKIVGPKNKPYKRPRDWSVIAHSMGTIVAHDTLSAIQNHAMHVGYERALSSASIVGMIANVIPPMSSNKFAPPYNDAMKPGGSDSICDNYLTCSHKLDPLVQAFPFKGDAWQDLLGSPLGGDGRFTFLPNLNHYRPDVLLDDKNEIPPLDKIIPHSFKHYFSNPKVHIPFFSAWDSTFVLRNKKKVGYFTAYEEQTDRVQREAIADLLDNLISAELEKKDKRLVEYWRKAYQLMEGVFL